jgi:dipeptidyl-peptidase-4
MEWAASPDEIVIQYLNRHQNTNRLMLGNARTGNMRIIHTETDNAWLDVVDDMKWMGQGNEFTWISERTGWRHVYIISRDGSRMTPVTRGAFDVISVVMIDDANGYLYFMASPGDATRSYLYRTPMDGQSEPERLTPENWPGSHTYQVSPDGQWAIHTRSDFNTPPVTTLVDLPEHRQMRVLLDNDGLKARIARLKKRPVEFFTVDIGGGVELDGWMIKPYDFDPTQQYPVFFYVYGEPAGATVRDGWYGNYYLWFTMLAQKGYLVISIDNRGTPAPKGRDWRKCVYKEIGVLSSADQAAAARKISEWPFTDPGRMGIFGWSGGGSNTLNAMFRYPQIYRTGMSVAPVPDQRLYDAIYQERYMRTVEENPEGYRDGSPITYAKNLQGHLLLVHGTGDDNVHYQGTELLINELVKHNKPFTMMAYPNRSHGIYEGEGTTRHLFGLLTRYLIEHLPPGPE